MDIALKPVVYIFLALFSLVLLITLVPSLLVSTQKSYCNAFVGSNLIPSECENNSTLYQENKINIGPNEEGKIVSAIAACHQQPEGLCYILYFEADVNQTRLLEMINSSGVSFNMSIHPETFRAGVLLSMYNENHTIVIR